VTRRWLLIGWLLALLASGSALSNGEAGVRTEFFGESGDAPAGLLLYYLADEAPTRPKLVVELGRDASSGQLTAHVYDAPPGFDHVPITVDGSVPRLPPSRVPTVSIAARGAAWQSDGVPNYDLDIVVRGPVFAVWGLQLSRRFGEVPSSEHLATIMVRPDVAGRPLWDLRTLDALDHFRGEGVYRMNYAERKCETQLALQPSVSPMWPYVSLTHGDLDSLAAGRHFEQKNGLLAPPIVVDWNAGRIVTFSEIVTARNQNCSYAAYSFDEFVPDALNDANFETPFAFYDLSGAGRGFPNLILRTERYRPGDMWSTGIDPARQRGRPTLVDIVNVRYSWAIGVGNGSFDFKIDVVGPKPYAYDTDIADGYGSITAPAYDAFPSWVIDQPWPAVAFIGVEGRRYVSNEGIYSWFGATELGAYATGQATDPGRDPFGLHGRGGSRMVPGLRGEVVYGRDVVPRLYLSAIDNRLHLHGAVRGTWLIDARHRLDVRAVPGAREINHWQLFDGDDVVGQLVDFGDHLLFADVAGVTLRANSDTRELFSVAPPTDHASWEKFGGFVRPFQDQRRDPLDLGGWLTGFPGETWFVPGATFDSPALTEQGFQFVIRSGAGLSLDVGLPGTAPEGVLRDALLVRYVDGRFSYGVPADPAAVAGITVEDGAFAGERRIVLVIENRGDTDIHERVSLSIDGAAVWQRSGMGAGERVTETLPVALRAAGTYAAVLTVGDKNHALAPVEVGRVHRLGPLAVTSLSAGDLAPSAIIMSLIIVASLVLIVLAWASLVPRR